MIDFVNTKFIIYIVVNHYPIITLLTKNTYTYIHTHNEYHLFVVSLFEIIFKNLDDSDIEEYRFDRRVSGHIVSPFKTLDFRQWSLSSDQINRVVYGLSWSRYSLCSLIKVKKYEYSPLLPTLKYWSTGLLSYFRAPPPPLLSIL